MKILLIAAALGLAAAGAAQAQAPDQKGPDDHEAGVPLTPAEAAGAWTVATGGRDVCQLTLTAGHGVKAQPACNSALPASPVGWSPTGDGMQLTDAAGRPVLAFHRWSNSLFVSRRSSGADVQLRRGGPVAGGG